MSGPLLQYDWCPFEKRTQRHTGRMACRGGSREESDVSLSRGTPRVAGTLQKLDQMRKDSPLQISQGAWPY